MRNDKDQSNVIWALFFGLIILYGIVGFHLWSYNKTAEINAIDPLPTQERLNNIDVFSRACVRAGGIPDISQGSEMYCHIGEATHGYDVTKNNHE